VPQRLRITAFPIHSVSTETGIVFTIQSRFVSSLKASSGGLLGLNTWTRRILETLTNFLFRLLVKLALVIEVL
jgi:hypothetical protein